LELNHYVEIREEFDHVQNRLDQLMEEAWSSDTPCYAALMARIRYRSLRQRYRQLLLQIRFHELRVHFLEAYQLPLRLKVSDYLLKSQQAVMLQLVQVSPVAWLLLTGALNFLYYSTSLLSYQLHDAVANVILMAAFFGCMTVFAALAFVVHLKMKGIFKTIMLEKTLWGVHHVQSGERDRLAVQQLNLFWAGDPQLVIAAIQFMSFGYAVMLAIMIIFWKNIRVDNRDDYNYSSGLDFFMYLVVIAGCYAIFVTVTARVIPEYTMCTSLGQLVHEKILQESVASYLLDEAQRHAMECRELDRDQHLDDHVHSDNGRMIDKNGPSFVKVPPNKSLCQSQPTGSCSSSRVMTPNTTKVISQTKASTFLSDAAAAS